MKFLGHIIDENGVSTDPSKVEGIAKMTSTDLMEADGVTPSQTRIRSFLGMINYYQHVVPSFPAIAKSLFSLLTGQKRKGKQIPQLRQRSQGRKLSAADWTPVMEQAFQKLKVSLV